MTRIGTWISPGSNDLTYRQNFTRHVTRVREIARILGDHGVRFGLEYIGTPTLRRKPKHSFIHTMAEARELFAEVQRATSAWCSTRGTGSRPAIQ